MLREPSDGLDPRFPTDDDILRQPRPFVLSWQFMAGVATALGGLTLAAVIAGWRLG